MIFRDARDRLVHFRGDFPAKPLDARRIAGLLDAPGCMRRQVVDAASIPIKDLAPMLGCRAPSQSPFALQRGIRFEQTVTANAMTFLLPLVRKELQLDVRDVRQLDLSKPQISTQYPAIRDPRKITELRIKLTRDHTAEMLVGEHRAINLLRHPYLRFDLGDMPAFLEPDLIAYAASTGGLAPIEIKSFPRIDGVADPIKVAEAARQTAVYLVALRHLVTDLGHCDDRISTRGLLVMTRNFNLDATGELLNLRPQVLRLERMLTQFPHVTDLATHVPATVSLPAIPASDASDAVRRAAHAQAREAVAAIPMRMGDGCVACPLFDFCRSQAQLQDSVAQLGTQAANTCGDVGTVTAALDLAAGRRAPTDIAEGAVADELRRAATAIRLAEDAA